MPFYYKIDKESRLVMSTGSGVLTVADSLAHQDELLKDPDFRPSFSQLMDLTHVTKLEHTSEDVRRVAQRPVFSPSSRRAILVTADMTFEVARRFEMLREALGEKGIRVFRDLDDALEWVLAKNTTA
jgi:hypothetical protein